jgi:hypothetical protein
LYGGIILVLDDIRRIVEVSGMEESETYEEYMARNEGNHMYLEEEHPRY